jgi:hypothetical protein
VVDRLKAPLIAPQRYSCHNSPICEYITLAADVIQDGYETILKNRGRPNPITEETQSMRRIPCPVINFEMKQATCKNQRGL